ncbi:hypothetical protein BDP27DRAFT_1401965 [Rhodocollybia butyracea]|uniref:Secreted protein n=1 Tax=Rhodocollybia butyracea TaxID=206335 RepID=A0A9P5U950_9AGAR|nr:hypothetical protein BDP27DRAFT_1401965 [Rhodocollybia butyracea]
MIAPSRFVKLSALLTSFIFLQGVSAVCASGQMAVGSYFFQEFTGPSGSFDVFGGFLMANDCGIIAESTATQDSNTMCVASAYDDGVSVTCDSNHQPIAAVDTLGQHWTCSPSSDGSCDVGGSGGRFDVLACCNRS